MTATLGMMRTCTIKTSGASASSDGDGQPIAGADVTVTGVMCRYGDLSRSEIVSLEIAGLDNIAGYLMVPFAAAVAMKSRVSAVTNRQGQIEQAGPFEVARITERRTDMGAYKTLLLTRIKPQDNA